jgi:hypothetical protein
MKGNGFKNLQYMKKEPTEIRYSDHSEPEEVENIN